LNIRFGSNQVGKISGKLPAGPIYDNYNIYAYVKIIDNDNGVTIYNLPNPVQVRQNETIIQELLNQLITQDPMSSFNQLLSIGGVEEIAQNVAMLASFINNICLEYKKTYFDNRKSCMIVNMQLDLLIKINFYLISEYGLPMTFFGEENGLTFNLNFNQIENLRKFTRYYRVI